MELIEREQLPNDVRYTLAGSLSGDLRRQQLLFCAMIDTWPFLQKCLTEVLRGVRKAPWKTKAWCRRGGKPTPESEKLANEMDNAIWQMRPDPLRQKAGFERTVENVALGYYLGHNVLEIEWMLDFLGEDSTSEEWVPKSTRIVPPRFYGYPYVGEGEDRLMLDRDGGMSGINNYEDFPAHKFLVAVNGGHPGHASIAAPLRALTGYWLAAVYGLKWFTKFSELCGVPIRWAEYGDKNDKEAVSKMLKEMGSAAWGAFPTGTKVQFVESNKSSQSLPQKSLLEMADEQCAQFILGQTLTSSQGDKGSQALGKIHMGVRQDVIEGLCDFVGEVLTHQLSASYVELNYGASRRDIPQIWAEWPIVRDEKALAERDEKLGIISGKTPVDKAWFYDRHGIPMPAADAELLIPDPDQSEEPSKSNAPDGADDEEDGSGKVKEQKKAKVAASDAGGWELFAEDSGTLGIPRREMPQILSSNRAAMVQFLRSRGIESREETVNPASLKPTQAEYAPAKVEAARNYQGGNRAILISEDDYVVDGHHQWLAEDEPIRVIRLMAPIARVLMMTHRMPSTQVAASIREDLDDGAASKAEAEQFYQQLTTTLKEGSVTDWKAVAMLMAVGFADGASADGKEPADG